jgi:type II secretory pathway pseudopilin PulG
MIKNSQNQTGSALVIVIVIVAIGIIGALSYVVWKTYFQAPQKSNQTSTTSSQTQSNKEKVSEDSNSTFSVAELGIVLTVPESLHDLTYRYDSDHRVAWFSTRSLTEKYEGCSTSGVAPPLGALTKTDGAYPENPNRDNSSGVLIRQFEGFYVSYGSPQSLCSEDQTAVPVELQLFRDSLSTLSES